MLDRCQIVKEIKQTPRRQKDKKIEQSRLTNQLFMEKSQLSL
jgi:hypothetical protein